MEFVVVPPDIVLPVWLSQSNPLNTSEIASFLSQFNVLDYFDKCANWEVQYNSSCDSSIPSGSHMLYGNPCNSSTQTFDTSSCVFARCSTGYYYTSRNTCSRIPSFLNPTSHYYWVILATVVFALLVPFLVYRFFWTSYRTQTEHTRYHSIIAEYQPMDDLPISTN